MEAQPSLYDRDQCAGKFVRQNNIGKSAIQFAKKLMLTKEWELIKDKYKIEKIVGEGA